MYLVLLGSINQSIYQSQGLLKERSPEETVAMRVAER